MVYLSPIITNWVSKQDSDSFENYIRAIEGVRKMADLFSKYTITSCGNGFLIFVEGEDVALRCAFYEERRQIHIISFIS